MMTINKEFKKDVAKITNDKKIKIFKLKRKDTSLEN